MTGPAVALAARSQTDRTWLRLAQLSVALAVPALAVFAVTGTYFATISQGDFRYTADYWYTGAGLPIAVAGAGIALAVHKLQHGADGRLGTVGVWVNTLALTELFVQLLASVLTSSEVRWGPSYPVCVLLSFVGTALLAAASWRSQLAPRWMLGLWPVVWTIGSMAAFGLTPLALIAFLVILAGALARRVGARAGAA